MREARVRNISKSTVIDNPSTRERVAKQQGGQMMNSVYQHYHDFQLFDVVKLAEIEKKEMQIAKRKKELKRVKDFSFGLN